MILCGMCCNFNKNLFDVGICMLNLVSMFDIINDLIVCVGYYCLIFVFYEFIIFNKVMRCILSR